MRRPAAVFRVVLALGAMSLAPMADAQPQDGRQEGGPFEIEKCRTIDKTGSYKLVNDLTFSGTTTSNSIVGTCLTITASFVTIDLAGFTITGPEADGRLNVTTAIAAQSSSGSLLGIAVRNGSISGFGSGVALSSAGGSIVEGLRVFGGCPCAGTGIQANGVVRDNSAVGFVGPDGSGGEGIGATGIVTGNFVSGNKLGGISIGQGSTVIGNTATDALGFDIAVTCPSNVTDNTTVNPAGDVGSIRLSGAGCNTTNNVGNVIGP